MSILRKYNKTQNDKDEVLQFTELYASVRSAWGRGVLEYARDLIDDLPDDWEYTNAADLERKLLNGAQDWKAYSFGGCSLLYDEDICKRLATPSEQKKTRNGERNSNGRESWLDCQARALFQAFILIRRTCEGLKID